ncbi:MAG: hypothetical protein GY810_15385 [Aureispira sp.]|nr:hypothetical protein [Aureispira sp.]
MPKNILDSPLEDINLINSANTRRRWLLYGLHFLILSLGLNSIVYLAGLGVFGETDLVVYLIWAMIIFIPSLSLVLLCRHAFKIGWGDTIGVAFFAFAGALIGSIPIVNVLYNSGFIPYIDDSFIPEMDNTTNTEDEFMAGFVVSTMVYSSLIVFWLELGNWLNHRFSKKKNSNPS